MPEPTGRVRTKVEIDGEKEAIKKLKSVERGFDQLGKGAGGINSLMRDLGPRFAIGVAAATTALYAMQRAARAAFDAIVLLGQRGGAVSAASIAFERIADPDLLRRLHDVTGGLVTAGTLITNATRARVTVCIHSEKINSPSGCKQ